MSRLLLLRPRSKPPVRLAAMSQLSTHQRPTPTHHHHHHHQCHHRRSYQRAIRSIRPPHRPIAPSQTTKLPSSSRSTLSKPAGASGGTARTRPPPLLSLPLLQLLLPWAKLPRRRTMEEQLQQMRPPMPRLMLVLSRLAPTRPRSRSNNSNMSTTPACTPSHSCRWRPSTQSRASARTYSAAVRCSLAQPAQLTHCFTQRSAYRYLTRAYDLPKDTNYFLFREGHLPMWEVRASYRSQAGMSASS